MQDFLGKDLVIGDTVLFIAPSYRKYAIGTIAKFTGKYAIIEYVNTWNYATGFKTDIKQTGEQLVKI
jgi:hypothetical protein